jgi:hypothetical protein
MCLKRILCESNTMTMTVIVVVEAAERKINLIHKIHMQTSMVKFCGGFPLQSKNRGHSSMPLII